MRGKGQEDKAEIAILIAIGECGIVASSYSLRSLSVALAWLGEILSRRSLDGECERKGVNFGEAVRAFWNSDPGIFEMLDTRGLTKHDIRVYRWLTENVPMGKRVTYGEVASSIGSSPRAVGRALARNPFPPLVPCHRVVSRRGIGGFSGPLEEKALLLSLEASRGF